MLYNHINNDNNYNHFYYFRIFKSFMLTCWGTGWREQGWWLYTGTVVSDQVRWPSEVGTSAAPNYSSDTRPPESAKRCHLLGQWESNSERERLILLYQGLQQRKRNWLCLNCWWLAVGTCGACLMPCGFSVTGFMGVSSMPGSRSYSLSSGRLSVFSW